MRVADLLFDGDKGDDLYVAALEITDADSSIQGLIKIRLNPTETAALNRLFNRVKGRALEALKAQGDE